MRRGGFQSKRSRGVNFPSVAARGRATRLRSSRSRRSISTSFSVICTGEKRLRVACSRKARRDSMGKRKPRSRSWAMTSSIDIVVTSQVVGDDISVRHIVWHGHLDRDGMFGGTALLLAKDAQRARIVRATGDGFCDRQGEDVVPVEVEESLRLGHHEPDVAASFDPATDQDINVGSRSPQSIASRRRISPALLSDDLRAMLMRLDFLALAPIPLVLSHHGLPTQNAYALIVGHQGQGLLNAVGRHRVEVGIEASKGCLVDGYRLDEVGCWQGIGHTDEPPLLLGQAVGDGFLAELRVGHGMSNIVDEGQQFAVALLDAVDLPAGEEAVAQETNLPLHTAFLIAAPGPAQAWLHVEGRGQVEQQGMKADRFAVALEHHDLGIVEK